MARPRPDLDERFRHSKLKRYLLADENVLIAQRQHWTALWKPIAIGVAGLFVVVTLNYFLPPSMLTDLLWWALLALAIWNALRWFEWRRNWMVATNKRVMVNHGLVNQGVAMFSLGRVPDLTYSRSTLGRLLGYGELKRESTGDGQTLHKLRFVEHPHATYTTICAAIFDLQDRMFGMDEDENEHRFEDGPPPHAPGLYAGYIPPEERTGPTEPPDHSDQADQAADSIGIRVHYGTGSKQSNRETVHQSADLRESSLRDADTGPIYRRSTTDADYDWHPTTDADYDSHRTTDENDRDR